MDYSGRCFRIFGASWFDSGYMLLPVYGSLLFPYTAQFLVLSGTCYASVTEFAFFHVFVFHAFSA